MVHLIPFVLGLRPLCWVLWRSRRSGGSTHPRNGTAESVHAMQWVSMAHFRPCLARFQGSSEMAYQSTDVKRPVPTQAPQKSAPNLARLSAELRESHTCMYARSVVAQRPPGIPSILEAAATSQDISGRGYSSPHFFHVCWALSRLFSSSRRSDNSRDRSRNSGLGKIPGKDSFP